MNMLNELHDWLEGKNCNELDDRQLGRKIQTAYRHDEPPTPADALFARIRARAEHTSQLPPVVETQPKRVPMATVQTVTPVAVIPKKTPPPTRQSAWAIWRKWWAGQSAEEAGQRSVRAYHRENYRQIMDYALHQMRISLIGTGMHLL